MVDMCEYTYAMRVCTNRACWRKKELATKAVDSSEISNGSDSRSQERCKKSRNIMIVMMKSASVRISNWRLNCRLHV